MDHRKFIRDIPDFPKKGIIFKDITPLLKDPEAFSALIAEMARTYSSMKIDAVVAIEARGFILGGALAVALGTGFVPVRKKGKLPHKTCSASYGLEYGTDVIEVHEDAIKNGGRYLLLDDVLATGGTMVACVRLVEELGGEVEACAFVIELSFLKGRDKLPGHRVDSVIAY